VGQHRLGVRDGEATPSQHVTNVTARPAGNGHLRCTIEADEETAMLHQPSTRFAATEPAIAESLSLGLPEAAMAGMDEGRTPPGTDESGADQPWSHPARLSRPRAGQTRLFIDCASL
jgi:hypothetical protein